MTGSCHSGEGCRNEDVGCRNDRVLSFGVLSSGLRSIDYILGDIYEWHLLSFGLRSIDDIFVVYLSFGLRSIDYILGDVD